jgi:drug/metabolite transporter (DMT)-like permease
MSGSLWAAAAGVGFGVFQALNRRAVRGMDVYLATFLQLLLSTVVLALAAVATEDLSVLWPLPLGALVSFGLAAFIHFFVGWTLLNASQKLIGAARTSPLIGTTPLFGALIAALTLGEVPGLLAIVGIVVVVAGMYVLSGGAAAAPGEPVVGWRGSLFGIGTALCWALSPTFIRAGLTHIPSPLLGLTAGLIPCVAAYGIMVLVRHTSRPTLSAVAGDALAFKIVAGILVGLSTWMRWIALDLAQVGVVLAISQISVPVVILLSPLVAGRQHERVTGRVWLGAALTVIGSLLLVIY